MPLIMDDRLDIDDLFGDAAALQLPTPLQRASAARRGVALKWLLSVSIDRILEA
jgi:hypothetical protein